MIEITSRLGGEVLRRVDADTLAQADLADAHLRAADLRAANLAGARLIAADVSDALLMGANLAGANMQRVLLYDTNLTAATLTGARLEEADLREAWLKGADLTGASLRNARLDNADFTEAVLTNVDVTGATYNGGTQWPADFDAQAHGAQLRAQAPFPEHRLRAEEESAEDADVSDNDAPRTKLGGEPDWIQPRDETPDCETCGQPMVLVAQVGWSDRGPDLIADLGMLYFFTCRDCFGSRVVDQHY
jgi:hypothetical protein